MGAGGPGKALGPFISSEAVAGVGRIGSFHAGVLSSHPAVHQVLITDPDGDRAAAVARDIGAEVSPSVEALLGAVDAVVITIPTITHADLIRQAAGAGLGRIYIVRMCGHDPHPPHDDYIPGSGGLFRDFHIHDFDIGRHVTGQEVTEV